MKAFVVQGPNKYAIEDLPVPQVGDHEFLARVKAVGICSTDNSILDGKIPIAKYPIIPGHEWSGEIVELGKNVDGFRRGDKVTSEAMLPCGKCINCRYGLFHLCDHYGEIGYTRNGAYAEYVKGPARNLHRLPTNISFEEAALTEPLACVTHSFSSLGILPADVVAVLGPGPNGLLFVQITRCAGGEVILVGTRDSRLNLGKKLGADMTINLREKDSTHEILEYTDSRGVDVVIEATGRPEAVVQSLDIVKKGGRVLLYGIQKGKLVSIDVDRIVMREVTVRGSSANPGTWDRSLKLMSSGRIQVKPLISHCFPLDQVERALEVKANRLEDSLKVILKP